MNISQRLRTCARHTGLDAVIDLLNEAADEIDALQARAQVHPAQAEVTDHVIRKTYSDVMTALREENRHVIGGAVAIEIDMPVRFARAILVLRTERVPMTREQVFASAELMAINGSLLGLSMCDLMQVIRIIEALHGITAKAKKEDA